MAINFEDDVEVAAIVDAIRHTFLTYSGETLSDSQCRDFIDAAQMNGLDLSVDDE